jgi:hypothetical protein
MLSNDRRTVPEDVGDLLESNTLLQPSRCQRMTVAVRVRIRYTRFLKADQPF